MPTVRGMQPPAARLTSRLGSTKGMRVVTRGTGGSGVRATRCLPALILLLAATACGESAAAHARIGAGAARFWGEGTPAPQESPNGENAGPAISTFTYKVTTVMTRTVRTIEGPRDPLRLCPVQGTGSFSDDFGAPRYA